MMKTSTFAWEEPNRANTPPLHIASRGERFSTVTGIHWIDDFRFIVNHRNGLRIALFDTRSGKEPVATVPIPHLTDHIAAKQLSTATWEVAVSGCWDAIYSSYQLVISDSEVNFQLTSTKKHHDKTFCHGISYDANGNLCLALHTGENPRIEIANKIWKLPAPWGARDVCEDVSDGTYYAVAVSKNPSLAAYGQTSTSIWSKTVNSDHWRRIKTIDDMHSDSCQVYQSRLWLPDQKGDRILGVPLDQNKTPLAIKGSCFDFPHGLAISKKGILAITNYGASNIVLTDISEL
jgi:hypothetical protein